MTTSKLSSTDRKQLCKITNGRFEILREKLGTRKNIIYDEIKRQVLSEHEKEIAEFRKRFIAVNKEEERENTRHTKVLSEIVTKRESVTNDAVDKGLRVAKTYGTSVPSIEPRNLNDTVDKRMEEINKTYRTATSELRTKEWDILEKISVSGIENQEAIKFLSEIPELDKLLPPVDGKAIEK